MIPAARLAGRPLLLLFDVDGTLAPIVAHPTLAHVPDARVASLQSLVDEAGRNGRSRLRTSGTRRASDWSASSASGPSGNHGAEIIDPNGDITVDPEVSRYAESMARTAQTLEPLLSPIRGVMLENKTWTLSVHYRAANERVVPRLRGVVEGVATEHGLSVTEGKKVLEIRPPLASTRERRFRARCATLVPVRERCVDSVRRR